MVTWLLRAVAVKSAYCAPGSGVASLSQPTRGGVEARGCPARGRIAAALRPRLQGGAVIGVERGFALEDADGTLTYLDPQWVTGQLRMNEGACDPDGRFYGGSVGHDHQRGAEALYRLDPDCSARMVLDHVTIFNGLDWSRDGARAFYADTETHRVDVFD